MAEKISELHLASRCAKMARCGHQPHQVQGILQHLSAFDNLLATLIDEMRGLVCMPTLISPREPRPRSWTQYVVDLSYRSEPRTRLEAALKRRHGAPNEDFAGPAGVASSSDLETEPIPVPREGSHTKT